MKKVRDCVEKFPYVAMDTEFPGVVARPIGSFNSSMEYHYQTLRCNCDMLKIIQLGLAFYDEKGNRAEGYPIWQFNFKFSLDEDMFAQDSIELLQRSLHHQRIGHAYLFSGSIRASLELAAMALAKAVNCRTGHVWLMSPMPTLKRCLTPCRTGV